MEYVTNAFPYYIEVTAEANSDGVTYTCTDNPANAENAYANGRDVKVRLTVTGENATTQKSIYDLFLCWSFDGINVFGFAIPMLYSIGVAKQLYLAKTDSGFNIATSLE